MWRILIPLILIMIISGCERNDPQPVIAPHAVILIYHRVGEDNYPSTNVTLEQFEAQIQILTQGGYHVLPVLTIIDALQHGKSLPDKTVGITIDDAYESAYTQAWPRLRAAHLPFTLLVSTDSIDKHYKNMMTWPQIRELARDGVTIGMHSASHHKLIQMDDAAILADLQRAQSRLQQEVGEKATILFAYPYGEYDLNSADLLKQLGIVAAFKQVSGVITAHSDFYALPRFPINEAYGDAERFTLITQALPFDIKDLTPPDPVLIQNPPIIAFTIIDPDLLMHSMSCYQSDEGKLPIVVDQNRVVITPNQPFTLRRTHINCTVADENKRWHWLGLMYILPEADED